LALSAVKSYTVIDGELRGFIITLSSITDGSPQAVIEADLLTKMRTGAASGVAAASLARTGATTVGIIGCGRQAPFQLDAVRRSPPHLTHALAWCRNPQSLEAFCAHTGARPASSAEEVAECDVVLASTTSPNPVINGAWLRPGALVIALGGDGHGDRELDDEAIRRATLVTCDSIDASRTDAADIWAPVESGILSWDAVIELQDVITGRHAGRASDDDIVFFKSNGLAAWDVATAAALIASPTND
jgi:ornithine cyclodeaminase/alanine dehydrogenase-like protein (mu-crystallin family)